MKYLLDVSTLLAWIWVNHSDHDRVIAWKQGHEFASCAITDIGFIRISTQPAFGGTIEQARAALAEWREDNQAILIPCDLDLLQGHVAPSSKLTTDFYLADLAQKHGMLWATLDEKSGHPAAFVIPRLA